MTAAACAEGVTSGAALRRGKRQRTPHRLRRTGALLLLPGFKGMFHPRRSPEQFAAHAKFSRVCLCYQTRRAHFDL